MSSNSITSPMAGYQEAVDAAKACRDAASGERAVKLLGRYRYLPHPNIADATSSDARVAELAAQRYGQYLTRAVYTNYTGQTQVTMIGQAFRRPPALDVPAQLDYVATDIDGAGQGITQLAAECVNELMLGGAIGLLVDYPRIDQPITMEDQARDGIRAFCRAYRTEDIIRFRTRRIGGRTMVTTVVLQEPAPSDDDMTDDTAYQYRKLWLDEQGLYNQSLFDAAGVEQQGWPAQPRAAGQPMREIPFFLAGAVTNNAGYQEPMLADIASLNLAHYRDSADLQESLHIAGQPTLFVTSSMSADEWAQANPNGIQIGSRRGVFLGEGGQAQMLQAVAGTGLEAAMAKKEEAMRQLGARLIEQGGSNKTAEAARIDAGVSSASLMTVVNNTEIAILAAIGWMADFMGASREQISFKMNREFSAASLTPQDVAALAQAVGLGIIGKSDAQNKLRAAGWIEADRTNDDIDAEVAEGGDGLEL